MHVTVYTVFEMKYKTRFRQLLRGCGAPHNISMECEKKKKKKKKAGLKCYFTAQNTIKNKNETN